jgi:hypothetical protein
MFKKIGITISAAALVMLAIALAPAVPKALATAHTMTTTKDEATLKQPLAEQPCEAFETWFLDPACSQTQHAKKAARIKHRLAQRP